MSVALISLTIVNVLVSPLTIFLNVLVILDVKTTSQLRDKYNVLLPCLAGTDIMTGAIKAKKSGNLLCPRSQKRLHCYKLNKCQQTPGANHDAGNICYCSV